MHSIRVVKWSGSLCCVLIAGVWLLTVPTVGRFRIEVHRIGNRSIVSLSEGCLTFSRNAFAASQPGRWYVAGVTGRPFNPPPMCYGVWRPFVRTDPAAQMIMLPLWLVLLACAIPTGLLWFSVCRPTAVGCCLKCRYDLTGNVSGRCPECGTVNPMDNNSRNETQIQAQSSHRRIVRTIVIVGLIPIVGLAIFIGDWMIRGFPRAQELRRRSLCLSHLRNIGQAVQEYSVKYSSAPNPATVDTLVSAGLLDPSDARCPNGGSYVLAPFPDPAHQVTDSSRIVAYEPPSNHGEVIGAVLADGHAACGKAEAFQPPR